jgi:hypothetical protein
VSQPPSAFNGADEDGSDDLNGGMNVRVGLLLVYVFGDFEIEGIIWLGDGWITSPADQHFNLGRGGGPRRATCE